MSDTSVVTAPVVLFLSAANTMLFAYIVGFLLIKEVRNRLVQICNSSDILSETIPVPWPAPKFMASYFHWVLMLSFFIGLGSNVVAIYFSWEVAYDDPTLDGDDTLVTAFIIAMVLHFTHLFFTFLWVKFMFWRHSLWIAIAATTFSLYIAIVFCWILWWTAVLQFVVVALALYTVYFSLFLFYTQPIYNQPIYNQSLKQ